MRSIGTIAHELWNHHGTVYIRIYKKNRHMYHVDLSFRIKPCVYMATPVIYFWMQVFNCAQPKGKIDTHGRFIYKKVAAPVRGNKCDYRKLTPSPGITNVSHQLYNVSFCFTIFEVSWFTWVRFHNVLSMVNTFAGISMHSQCSTGCYI